MPSGLELRANSFKLLCAALMILLAAFAAVQYRWSTRVAAADAQREREHLDSAASLFATQFDDIAGQTIEFLENDAREAARSGGRTAAVPKILAEVYYVDVPDTGAPSFLRLAPDGAFAPAPRPAWISAPHCAAMALEQPLALIAPVYEIPRPELGSQIGVHVFRRFGRMPERCFIARLDQPYLTGTLIPQLIRRSFGETSVRDYDFSVVSHAGNRIVYGAPIRADLSKPFFSVRPVNIAFQKRPGSPGPPNGTGIYVERMESTIVVKGGPSPAGDLFGPGIWDLRVAHKDVPLAEAFDRTRRRDLLLSVGVEVLLAAAILFLVLAAGRAQRLADQKLQFVAGVSHELRSPVSAIAMLSRNQADGLVSGTERVKQYGELIHQQSRRLNDMVEQALAYAGIHSGLRRPARTEIDLKHLIEEAVESRREELSRAGFEIQIALAPDLPSVSGDPALLRTAFDNLLDNARKHAGTGRWIRVTAMYSAQEKQVRIAVEDRGAGIDPSDQAEIFEPFSRGRAAVEQQIPGSGLGLSMVRSAAEAHRGSVTLESRPGQGSTFTLHLPV